jgi:DNA helicase II / ATP-dependent DNA helicase PcrA
MRFAADLHLHSRYASGVSPLMTVENLALWAQRKGMDLLATGDCLQADWLRELEAALVETEPGFFALRAEVEERVWQKLPPVLRKPLRFVLSTEVCCAPAGTPEIRGLHFLIYFPSFEHVRGFRSSIAQNGDLTEGRPTLNLTPLALLERVLDEQSDCHLAPAHILNPWFSALGTVGGVHSLQELFDDRATELLAVETGLTSNPLICRRMSSLDRLGLFSCSDAHSPDKLGREYTLLEIEPGYANLFSALRDGSTKHIVGTRKVSLSDTKYFLNWCSQCKRPWDALRCPRCQRPTTTGARDRLEKIADRREPRLPANSPPHLDLRPLAHVVADVVARSPGSETVRRQTYSLIETLGSERFVLCEAPEEAIRSSASPAIAAAILDQRTHGAKPKDPDAPRTPLKTGDADQPSFDFPAQ